MTVPQDVKTNLGSLPLDGRLMPQSRSESVDGVAFVSGTQGVIATTFTVEEFHRQTGESRHRPVFGSAVLVIPMDIFTFGEIIQNWKVS
jgi:hypothetical protein